MEQTKELASQYNYETGETYSRYRMAAPRFVFNIPFTPKKVDEILHSEHPFGPDSQNKTKENKVIFYGMGICYATVVGAYDCGNSSQKNIGQTTTSIALSV